MDESEVIMEAEVRSVDIRCIVSETETGVAQGYAKIVGINDKPTLHVGPFVDNERGIAMALTMAVEVLVNYAWTDPSFVEKFTSGNADWRTDSRQGREAQDAKDQAAIMATLPIDERIVFYTKNDSGFTDDGGWLMGGMGI